MCVKVDYLVVYSKGRDLTPILAKLLEDAIEKIYNEEIIDYEPQELKQYITIRYTKKREKDGHQICGFSIEFSNAAIGFNITEERMGVLINDFSKSLRDCKAEGIEHLLKLNDPQLQHTLRIYGEAIFEIEMKLREALSLIFIDIYDEDFYDLLKEVNVTPLRESAERMRKYYENQFFFLGFSDYVRINESKPLKQVGEVLKYIRESEDFEDLQRIIIATPIKKRSYVDFLASLKERVSSIEDLRNCVAHNKPIPDDIMEGYNMAKEPLLQSIEEFLEQQAMIIL